MLNTRPRWSTLEILMKVVHGFPVPLDFRFNATIHNIPHPPGQTMEFGLLADKCSIPNSLNAPTDEHMRANNFV
jgi:hypothetical protein